MTRPDPRPAGPVPFCKMHGLGNDFVILDRRAGDIPPVTPALARAVGDRHRGVGYDQLAELVADPVADVRVTYWNADGSTSAACGNATRCIAHLLLAEGRGPELQIAVEGRGTLAARRRPDGLIEVDMGPPLLDWDQIPLAEAMDTVALPLPGTPGAVSMGNPHCVHFVEDLDAVAMADLGRVETHPLFPARTNVQAVQVLARDHVRAIVWERGVGPTLASGSSSCAIVVAGHRKGLLDRRVRVDLPGGTIEIDWRPEGVAMAGAVAHVFDGVLTADWLAGVEA